MADWQSGMAENKVGISFSWYKRYNNTANG